MRLITTGGEIGLETDDIRAGFDGDRELSAGNITQTTTNARLGLGKCWKCDTGAGNVEAFAEWTPSATMVTDRSYFLRAYFFFPNATPSAEYSALAASVSGSTVVCIRHKTDGTLQLSRRVNTATNLGSASSVITANTWYRLEMRWKVASVGTTSEAEFWLDGVQLANVNGQNFNNTALNRLEAGTSTSPSANWVMYFDDVALNDDQSYPQNSFPGDGKVVLLKPISDNQRGSWVAGAGGTTNLYDAVDNTPPVGTATETNTTQIESTDTSGDNATDEYRTNLTTYANAGITVNDKITVLHPVIYSGDDTGTLTQTGSFGLQSNPGMTYDAFNVGLSGALGTWDANWRASWGTPQFNSLVTLSSSPVLAVRKTDATAGTTSVSFMGVYAEFITAPTGTVPGNAINGRINK